MSRRILSTSDMIKVTAAIVESLKGLPVQQALDILQSARGSLLYMSTVGQPGDDLIERQRDIEEITGPPLSRLPLIMEEA